MSARNTLISLVASFTAWTAAAPAAGAGDWQFDGDVSAGAGYDSNVGIEELESNSGEADNIIELIAGGAIAYTPDDQPIWLRLGYDYSATSYRRFETFDLDLHHGAATVGYRSSAFDASLTLDRYVAIRNGVDFVRVTQVSPGVARLFGERLYVRAAWIAATRDYHSLPGRDASTSAGRIDTYLLLDGLDRYISFAVQLNDETARASEFDYRGYQVAVSYARAFQWPRARLELKSSLRYEDRDYSEHTPAIGEPRSDRRLRAGLEAEMPLSKHVSLCAMLEHTRNDSNLDAAELAKSVAGIELRLSF